MASSKPPVGTSVSGDYSAITNIGAPTSPCKTTADLFNVTFVEQPLSAIDAYIVNCKEINILWAGATTISPEFGRILLLGYVSAIESFFRTIFRSIINTDAKAQADAHTYVIPYGAVLYHRKDTIAEALMEGYSFAAEKDIRKGLDKFLSISNIREDIDTLLEEYEKICQLRHCCVHRFGKLGTQNGIALGLEAHSKALEKPLALNKAKLEDIASWLMSFAKAVNNYMFSSLLERSVSEKNPYKVVWKWNYSKDRAKFERLYTVFKTTEDTSPSPSAEELYGRFQSVMKAREKAKATKGAKVSKATAGVSPGKP